MEILGTTRSYRPLNHVCISEAVFCRVLTNCTRGIYPGYYPTKNFCEFCRTFTPVPRTSASSVRHSYPYPKHLEVLYARAHNTRGAGTAFLYTLGTSVSSLGTSVSSVRPCHNTGNSWKFCEFCKPVAQYPGYGYTLVTIPGVAGTNCKLCIRVERVLTSCLVFCILTSRLFRQADATPQHEITQNQPRPQTHKHTHSSTTTRSPDTKP